MDKTTERAYKRKCFRGRGRAVCILDRAFFSALGGLSLYILTGQRLLALFLFTAALVLFTLWDRNKWRRFRQKLWLDTAQQLKRENWLKHTAEEIRQGGGILLYPTPNGDAFTGLCLRHGQGTAFHCVGNPDEDLKERALWAGCTATFHPWMEGEAPKAEQVENRLIQTAPKRIAGIWGALLRLSGSRYLLTGFVLLVLSMFLRRALCWRMIGTLCLFIGSVKQAIHLTKTI